MRTVHDVQVLLNRLAAKKQIEVTDRISAALKMAGSGRGGSADAAVLIRQVLRSDDVSRNAIGFSTGIDAESKATSAWLDVPHSQSFPPGFQWADFGLDSQPWSQASMRIRAAPWTPHWLDLDAVPAVDHDVSDLRIVRRDESVYGDPFLSLIDQNFTMYRTPGQRAAVRSALLAPEGSTLVVNLPTGAGKTLAMLAPTLASSGNNAISVVVVPTVALAIDQQNRYASRNPGAPPTAYHSGLTSDQKGAFSTA